MRPLALAATATLLGACALAPVASSPAARTVDVRGLVAPQGPGYALQAPPPSPMWTKPYAADLIATIHVALEQAPAASGAFPDLVAGDCDVTASGGFPTPDYTALPVVSGSAPPLVLSGLPLGQHYRVTLQAESAASGVISCPAMSRRIFSTVGAGVPDVITTTFPVRLFANPKYDTNFKTWLNVTPGDVGASGTAGPRLGTVGVVGCPPDHVVTTAELSTGTTGTWAQLDADSSAAPIYVVQGATGYRLVSVGAPGLKSGHFRNQGAYYRSNPVRRVCVELNGVSRAVEVWEPSPS